MDRSSAAPWWPEELAAFPEWNSDSSFWECSDVGEYDGVKLNSLYVRDCSSGSLQKYYCALVMAGFTEIQSGKFVKTSDGVKLCVDTGSIDPDENSFYIFFSSAKAIVPIIVTPRKHIPGWRKERRIERRSNRKKSRKRNRGVRQQRRQNRRSDRRMRRLFGEE